MAKTYDFSGIPAADIVPKQEPRPSAPAPVPAPTPAAQKEEAPKPIKPLKLALQAEAGVPASASTPTPAPASAPSPAPQQPSRAGQPPAKKSPNKAELAASVSISDMMNGIPVAALPVAALAVIGAKVAVAPKSSGVRACEFVLVRA